MVGFYQGGIRTGKTIPSQVGAATDLQQEVIESDAIVLYIRLSLSRACCFMRSVRQAWVILAIERDIDAAGSLD